MFDMVSYCPQVDMMSQEAAIQQIQDAKSMVEEDLQHKLEEFESEREHLLKLANTATALERELEQVNPIFLSIPHNPHLYQWLLLHNRCEVVWCEAAVMIYKLLFPILTCR